MAHIVQEKLKKKFVSNSPLGAKFFKSIFGELFRIRFEVGGGVKNTYEPLKSPLRMLKVLFQQFSNNLITKRI